MNSEYEKLAKMLTEIHVRVHLGSEVLLESRNLKEVLFLAEAIDPQQVEEQTVTTKQKLLQMTKLFPKETAGQLIAELEKLIKAIPEGSKMSSTLAGGDFAGDPASKELAKKYDTSVMLATTGMSRVVNSLTQISKAMEPFKADISGPDLEKLTIWELAKKVDTEKDFKNKFLTSKQIGIGLTKSFIPAAELKNAFQRGSKAAADSAGTSGAKSGLGKLFAKAATFLGGFFTAPAGKYYPQLRKAFEIYLVNSTPEEIFDMAGKLKVQGKNIVITANTAAQATSSVAAAAGGAPVTGQENKDDEQTASPDATPPDEVDDNLKDSLRNAAEEEDNPLQAVITGIEDWKNSLSKTSQKELTAKDRFDNLKDAIQNSAGRKKKKESIEKAVAAAVKDWVNSNQEDLVKSGKFAKKNFESLNTFIPQLVAHIEKKKKEGILALTNQEVRRIVFAHMNKNYLGSNNILNESIQIDRWRQLAGIK